MLAYWYRQFRIGNIFFFFKHRIIGCSGRKGTRCEAFQASDNRWQPRLRSTSELCRNFYLCLKMIKINKLLLSLDTNHASLNLLQINIKKQPFIITSFVFPHFPKLFKTSHHVLPSRTLISDIFNHSSRHFTKIKQYVHSTDLNINFPLPIYTSRENTWFIPIAKIHLRNNSVPLPEIEL